MSKYDIGDAIQPDFHLIQPKNIIDFIQFYIARRYSIVKVLFR